METQEKTNIRNPIITVCGHVDHGKTSLLDSLRGSSVADKEAGKITQKISFSKFSYEGLRMACPLIEEKGIHLDISGFLFIDTPGHAAFTNLRKRGGSLADLAILVIDLSEGIKPQTAEVLQILKMNKTPFVIALNKVDNISGWPKFDSTCPQDLREKIENLPINSKSLFDEKLYTLIAALNSYGFEADLFFNIQDFTKKIVLVPCSAKTQEGIPELMMVLCGVSQRYLKKQLELGQEAKGVILEIKKEKAMNYAEAILYDGELSRSDEIAIASLDPSQGAIVTKIRTIEEIEPMSSKFSLKEKVTASTGVRMQLINNEPVFPGMPFVALTSNRTNLAEIEKVFHKEVSENLTSSLSKQGIIAKADSLGSIEALLILLQQANIPVVKAGIGNISKNDIASAKANIDINELDAVIVGFNTGIDEDATELAKKDGIPIFRNEVIYKLIDDVVEFREKKAKEIEKRRLMELATICKLEILHQYMFRNSNPAIFGIRVSAGKLISDLPLIDETGEKIAHVKNIELDKKSVKEASEGMEIAMSLPGTNFERQLADRKFLYSDVSENQFKKFKKNKDLLSQSEIKTLSEIAEIKRRKRPDWGM